MQTVSFQLLATASRLLPHFYRPTSLPCKFPEVIRSLIIWVEVYLFCIRIVCYVMLWNGVKASCDTLRLWNHLRVCVCGDVCRCVLRFNAIRNVVQSDFSCWVWKITSKKLSVYERIMLFYYIHKRTGSWCKHWKKSFSRVQQYVKCVRTKGRGTRNDERMC